MLHSAPCHCTPAVESVEMQDVVIIPSVPTSNHAMDVDLAGVRQARSRVVDAAWRLHRSCVTTTHISVQHEDIELPVDLFRFSNLADAVYNFEDALSICMHDPRRTMSAPPSPRTRSWSHDVDGGVSSVAQPFRTVRPCRRSGDLYYEQVAVRASDAILDRG